MTWNFIQVAVVRPADLKYYTKTRDFTDVHVIGGRKAFASPTPVRTIPCGLHAWKFDHVL